MNKTQKIALLTVFVVAMVYVMYIISRNSVFTTCRKDGKPVPCPYGSEQWWDIYSRLAFEVAALAALGYGVYRVQKIRTVVIEK